VKEKEKIKKKAESLGFSKIGFTTPQSIKGDFLLQWLRKGAEAGMAYMRRYTELRLNPSLLLPGVKTIISLAVNYYPGDVFYKDVKISRYALGRDYHRVMKKMMKELFSYIKSLYPEARARFFVDSAPVLEREIARRAGLGWIGKNTMLVTREYGSWVFLGEIFLTVEIPPDRPFDRNFCGTCRRCIEACPTGALSPYFLDSNLCISYVTVEHKGKIPDFYFNKNNGWIFGCDICQEVCPWNRKAKKTSLKDFLPEPERIFITREKLSSMSRDEFQRLFKGTPVKRAGYEKIRKLVSNLNP